ncbi:MAG TPA: FAD:protein FMN transferase [Thermoanaerobaculia bacterium]|nr:FAD:protein FMN transferase [Thermoanaerobaculia bacterium]
MLPLLLVLLLGAPPSPSGARLSAKAFGGAVEVEVRDLPSAGAREVIQKALAEISEIERLTDSSRTDESLAALNAAAGKGPQALDSRLLAALTRALDFCFWSEGAHGPLGRDLYTLWGLRAQVAEPPAPERVEQAVGSAACSRLTLDQQRRTATLAEGSGLDLWGFAEGFAADRAVEVLRQGGAANGYVRIGPIQRAFGPGPGGKAQGWPVALPQVPGLEGSAGQVYLRDSALAVASRADHPLRDSGTAAFPYVNQRTGLPAQGVQMTAAVTELALDAQGLAVALLLTGPREGELRIGSLRPRPSVLWFLGSGAGTPLQVGYRWSEVSRK